MVNDCMNIMNEKVKNMYIPTEKLKLKTNRAHENDSTF